MRTIGFEIELLDDVVVSASGATSGGHRCLDYLPGAMFLGAAAGALYPKLGSEAFTAFHSGRVRFLPAFPLADDDALALPFPRSFHLEKYGSVRIETRLPSLEDPSLQNLARPGETPMERPELIEAPFLSAGGTIVRPLKRRVLKTAIDPASGRRQESQLFGYEALQAGSRFRAAVHLDDDVPKSVDANLESALVGTTLRLGRSKRREFGRVRTAKATCAYPAVASCEGLLLVYCLSDVALTDPESGQPTLEPRAEHFGLQPAEVAWEHTFLRPRRYSPINGKRLRPDLEHQVLVQGSVIAFRVARQPDAATLAKLLAGIGQFRAEGLGQVLVDPPFLSSRFPSYPADPLTKPLAALPRAADPSPHELQRWAEKQVLGRQRREFALAQAERWLATLRPYAGRSEGPGRAQWGLVRDRAATATSGGALMEDLFGNAPPDSPSPAAGLLRSGQRQRPWATRHHGVAAVDQLYELVAACPEDTRREAVLLLAARMQQEMQKEDRR